MYSGIMNVRVLVVVRRILGMPSLNFRLIAVDLLEAAVQDLVQNQIVERIWNRDHTVWCNSDQEIRNRLGWLDIHERMLPEAADLVQWASQVRAKGFRQGVLIGMGGSSLAPEMFHKVFGANEEPQGLPLHILDTTDPEQIAALEAQLNLPTTLFLVATKSGGTVETLSGFYYFWQQVSESNTEFPLGDHFVAITDPGSSLVALAQDHGFQRCFENDPNIGGRYSALSHFGLVPLALLGVDVAQFLRPAVSAANQTRDVPASNDAAQLGILMSRLANQGRNKLTLLMPDTLSSLGDWLEQLIAESLGKEGKGIVPVLGEELADIPFWSDDRFCVVTTPLEPDGQLPAHMSRLADRCVQAGHPTVVIPLRAVEDLGGLLFLWEFATAVAGYGLGVHPFDQPDVEAAKVAARTFMADYEAGGQLPGSNFLPAGEEVLESFLAQRKPGDYLALHAYLPQNADIVSALSILRTQLSHRLGMAVTLGFGPRFLHSTGQLHKGGANNGLFLQLLREVPAEQDILIPAPRQAHTPITFGSLQRSQALGDAAVLEAQGRRIMSLALGSEPLLSLDALVA